MSILATEATTLNYAALERAWPTFETKILSLLNTLGLADKGLYCDHVALRVNTIVAADALKQAFSERGRIISDNQINGRSILIIEL
ncbi:MAG: VOC family protein, partial [Shewanella sp.]